MVARTLAVLAAPHRMVAHTLATLAALATLAGTGWWPTRWPCWPCWPHRMVAHTLAALATLAVLAVLAAHRRLSTDDDATAAQFADFVVALVLDGLRPRLPGDSLSSSPAPSR